MTCLCPTPGAELAISVLEDPFVHPSVVSSCSLHYLLSTHHPLLTFIETTKDSLSMATEAEVPCLLDQGSDDCNDDGLVISGFGSGKHSSLTCPQLMIEDLCPSFLLVKNCSQVLFWFFLGLVLGCLGYVLELLEDVSGWVSGLIWDCFQTRAFQHFKYSRGKL